MRDVDPIGNYACTRGRGAGAKTRKIAIVRRCAVRAPKDVASIER